VVALLEMVRYLKLLWVFHVDFVLRLTCPLLSPLWEEALRKLELSHFSAGTDVKTTEFMPFGMKFISDSTRLYHYAL
jgi:hypothetical protein